MLMAWFTLLPYPAWALRLSGSSVKAAPLANLLGNLRTIKQTLISISSIREVSEEKRGKKRKKLRENDRQKVELDECTAPIEKFSLELEDN